MKIIHHALETIDSTQTYAKLQIPYLDSSALTLFSANQQTAGRGRHERTWHSPPDVNLYLTFCFTLPNQRLPAYHITQILALCFCHLLNNDFTTIQIKWPNDLLINNKKIGGILSEVTHYQNHHWILCGVGFNVNTTLKDLQTIDQPATSLLEETGYFTNKDTLLNQLSDLFIQFVKTFFINGFGFFLEKYRRACMHQIGDLLYLPTGEPLKFIDIATDGALIAEDTKGVIHQLYTQVS